MIETLKIVTTVAMRGVIDRLTPEFTKATGLGIEMVFGPPSRAVEVVREGEAADVVVSTPEGIEDLAREGKVDGGSSRIVARMIMGLAIGKNAAASGMMFCSAAGKGPST